MIRLLYLCSSLFVFAAGTYYWNTPWSSISKKIPTFNTPQCKQTYLNFYKNDSIDIRVLFGYKDARPARFVADRYEKMNFIQRLQKPCENHEVLCGFRRSLTDADQLSKFIYGPDEKLKTILIQVKNSSVGPDDIENRRDPFQTWQSRHAQNTFTDGLKTADVVLYNGHSRAGGGPDFEPARLGPNHHAAYAWYKQNQPGFRQLIQTLQTPNLRLKLLGLFSCASNKLFAEKIRKTKNQFGLITSDKLIYFADAMDSLTETLKSLLEMKCQPEFRQAIETPSNQAGSHFIGFF